jgi:hypothetical protein
MRRLLACGVLAAGILAVTPAAPALAIAKCPSGFQCETVFFAGPGSDERVGSWFTDCDGTTTREGRMTQWSHTDQIRCNPF